MSADSPLRENQLIFNGINGATGGYLVSPISAEAVSKIAKGEKQDKNHLKDLKLRDRQSSKTTRGVKAGVDPLKLSSAGWGVIFAKEDGGKVPEIKEALSGLLDMRKSQAGELYQEFSNERGYHSGERYLDFLARHKIGPGPADPARVPYYLLIVGSPEVIPFDFQYQLDVQYAVGRIYFDGLDEYERYAQSVVGIEAGDTTTSRQATFFGVQNLDDPATQLSASNLVQPLVEEFSGKGQRPGWKIQSVVGERATKSSLTEILGGENSPALFFSASHGMGFPKDDQRQFPHQGALLCQDWPGPKSWKEPIPEAYYYSADDIPSEANFNGSIAFLFACYGAGTPQMDDFAHQAFRDPVAIAPRNFLSRLPQVLLSHAKGGMQAVIGHVERAWGYSFTWEQSGSQLAVFESALRTIMDGYPVGYAMEYFNARYAELSTVLSAELQGVQFGKLVDDVALAGNWTANNDARSYVIIGDPAVRIQSEQVEIDMAQASDMKFSSTREGHEDIEIPSRPQTDAGGDWLLESGDSFAQMQVGSQVENIKAAIAVYQAGLARISGEGGNEIWQQIQIANSYKLLYEWEGNPRYADEAEHYYSLVFKGLSPKEQQRERAALNFNLAHLNQLKYEKGGVSEAADRALVAYKQILTNVSRQEVPVIWAQAHYYLASLQILLSPMDGEKYQLIEAVDHLNQALTVFNADQNPYQFAGIKMKIGDLLLSQMEGDRAENIELAIQAYEAPLSELAILTQLIPESSIYMRLGDAYALRIKGDRTNNEFQALAYYKQCLASLRKIQDQGAIEDLEEKIAQLKSGK